MTYAFLVFHDHTTETWSFLPIFHKNTWEFRILIALCWNEEKVDVLGFYFFISHQFFNLFEFSPFSSLRIYLCSITFQTLLLFKEPIFQLPEPHIFLAANLFISQSNFYSWICQINFIICTVHILEKPSYQTTFSFT